MSDKKQVKETTPPPLLLMPAGEGLTLNPPHGGSLLMPLVQSEPSLMAPGAYCILLCKKYCHMCTVSLGIVRSVYRLHNRLDGYILNDRQASLPSILSITVCACHYTCAGVSSKPNKGWRSNM